jgi:hypothetical protein
MRGIQHLDIDFVYSILKTPSVAFNGVTYTLEILQYSQRTAVRVWPSFLS